MQFGRIKRKRDIGRFLIQPVESAVQHGQAEIAVNHEVLWRRLISRKIGQTRGLSPSLMSLGNLSPLNEISDVLENVRDVDAALKLYHLGPNSCRGSRFIPGNQE